MDQIGLTRIRTLIEISRETEIRLLNYIFLLRQWQLKMNLVSSSTLKDVWMRHVMDSIQIFQVAPTATQWVDIGSGAGFPGLIVAILLADLKRKNDELLKVHLVEVIRKKCSFLEAVSREIKKNDFDVSLTIHNKRIEIILPRLQVPNVVCARALTSLNRLFDITYCHLSAGAIGIFSKGQGYLKELTEAKQRWYFDVITHYSCVMNNSVILEIHNLKKK
ncbi:16S rRNA (guanine(527)-N(7))-methyltransferase RsmG [Candidatus Endowatersipora endosymbiont of Watersipora subatra]|uniref:16S rRNA (guanine(527)-N(7))-methyltransferase RsmG n=1 Tax=Candidatus Endowatersipora endosymbiont of Watersipora subatra TaxID=3077946 RepID=UPI00312C8051